MRAWMAVVILPGLLAARAGAQGTVPRVNYTNPLLAFGTTIPEDWDVVTQISGSVEIGLGAGSDATLPGYPSIWFFFTKRTPADEAQRLAADLQRLGAGEQAKVRQTGPDEWEITMASKGTRGPLVEQWLCRTQGGQSYVLGAMCTPQTAPQWKDDIDTCLRTFHLLEQPPARFFREPTENAYKLIVPEGWQWQGAIMRTRLVPGYFVWLVKSPDGLSGAFSGAPTVFDITTHYCPAEKAAGTLYLEQLRTIAPDARLVGVHPLPRVGQAVREAVSAAGIGNEALADKVIAEYLCTINSVPVGIRVEIFTLCLGKSEVLGRTIDWSMSSCGAWAPVQQFEQIYPLARGIVSSLRTGKDWWEKRWEPVNDALKHARQARDRVNAMWMAHISDGEVLREARDPVTGQPVLVPLKMSDPYEEPVNGVAQPVGDDQRPPDDRRRKLPNEVG